MFHKIRHMEEIPIDDIDLEFIRSITTMDIFEFMNYAADGRSNMSSTRRGKSSSLKSFFNYLTVHEGLLDSNPTENLSPAEKSQNPSPLPHVRAKPRAFKRRGRAG